MPIFRTFARVLRLGRSERKLNYLFVLGALGVACAQLLEPLLFGGVIDALAKEQEFSKYLLYWAGLGLVNVFFSILLSIFTDRFAHRQRLRAMELAFDRTISLPYRYHSLNGSGKAVRTIQMGADQIFHLTLSLFRDNLIAAWSIIILVPLALYLDPRLALVLFTLAIVYCGSNWLVMRRTHSGQARVELHHQDLAARLIDVMGNVTIVRAFTRVREEVALFRAKSEQVLREQYPVLTGWGLLNVITRISSMTAMMAIVAIGSSLVRHGSASQGEIVTFVGFSTLLIGRLDQLSGFFNRLVSQMPTLKNFFEIVDKVDMEEFYGDDFEDQPKGSVEFENVSFAYGGAGKSPGVANLSFSVKAGETIALVGPTGSGKSTCLSLLQRFYSPQRGRILIDGVDIQALSVESLCGSIATVFQEPGLFNRSIFENIQVGRPEASAREVEAAARRADAHDFILARPGGYQFVVGERGLALSGGERQRIAIARAILKDAPILVLDEATSALDNETERRVQETMDRLSLGKTTFVIAHRLSTIVSADRILVMQEGRIVQAGTFAALCRQNGLFARLLKAGELASGTSPPAAPFSAASPEIQPSPAMAASDRDPVFAGV